jgi:hypothetical protein
MGVEQLYHGRRQLSEEWQRCVGREIRAGADEDWFPDLSRLSFFSLGNRGSGIGDSSPAVSDFSTAASARLFLQSPGISRTNQGRGHLRHIAPLSASHRLPALAISPASISGFYIGALA